MIDELSKEVVSLTALVAGSLFVLTALIAGSRMSLSMTDRAHNLLL